MASSKDHKIMQSVSERIAQNPGGYETIFSSMNSLYQFEVFVRHVTSSNRLSMSFQLSHTATNELIVHKQTDLDPSQLCLHLRLQGAVYALTNADTEVGQRLCSILVRMFERSREPKVKRPLAVQETSNGKHESLGKKRKRKCAPGKVGNWRGDGVSKGNGELNLANICRVVIDLENVKSTEEYASRDVFLKRRLREAVLYLVGKFKLKYTEASIPVYIRRFLRKPTSPEEAQREKALLPVKGSPLYNQLKSEWEQFVEEYKDTKQYYRRKRARSSADKDAISVSDDNDDENLDDVLMVDELGSAGDQAMGHPSQATDDTVGEGDDLTPRNDSSTASGSQEPTNDTPSGEDNAIAHDQYNEQVALHQSEVVQSSKPDSAESSLLSEETLDDDDDQESTQETGTGHHEGERGEGANLDSEKGDEARRQPSEESSGTPKEESSGVQTEEPSGVQTEESSGTLKEESSGTPKEESSGTPKEESSGTPEEESSQDQPNDELVEVLSDGSQDQPYVASQGQPQEESQTHPANGSEKKQPDDKPPREAAEQQRAETTSPASQVSVPSNQREQVNQQQLQRDETRVTETTAPETSVDLPPSTTPPEAPETPGERFPVEESRQADPPSEVQASENPDETTTESTTSAHKDKPTQSSGSPPAKLDATTFMRQYLAKQNVSKERANSKWKMLAAEASEQSMKLKLNKGSGWTKARMSSAIWDVLSVWHEAVGPRKQQREQQPVINKAKVSRMSAKEFFKFSLTQSGFSKKTDITKMVDQTSGETYASITVFAEHLARQSKSLELNNGNGFSAVRLKKEYYKL